jgi:hypothetical protein
MMRVNIFDLITAKEIGTYWTTAASNKIPYLGTTLFPAKKQLGLDLAWFKGSKGLPIALKPAAFDTKTTMRDRIGVTKVETEMPFFREGMRIGEKERQELLKAMGAVNSAFIMPIINKIYDDASNLIDGALVNPERMIMQLLGYGSIAISAVDEGTRIDYVYDYHFNPNHMETLAGTDVWSDHDNSTPIQDIQRWQDTIEDGTGVRPTRAICGRTRWNDLLMNKSIKLDMNPNGGQNVILTDSMLQQYLLAKLGLTVAVYNKKYNLNGTPTTFFPEDKFSLIPDGTLGNTWYGTTPEEADLMSGATDAEVQIVNTGVAITTLKEKDPVNVMMKVSEIVLPSFEAIDQVFIAKVA